MAHLGVLAARERLAISVPEVTGSQGVRGSNPLSSTHEVPGQGHVPFVGSRQSAEIIGLDLPQ
jgi:hypothetical protein